MDLRAGDVAVTVDPARGGRVASLRVADLGLGGSYPMVPWAGRVRAGRFGFRGTTRELPLDAPPHAIHGVGYRTPWEETGPGSLRLELGGHWPFGGTVTQEIALTATALTLTMTVTAAEQAMPVVMGWHPCFRRRLDAGEAAELTVPATSMWERDASGIPTGRQVPVPAGPWDDAFAGLRHDPRIIWPGAVEITLRSSCPVWVVYDRDPRLVCVEPQTDAPDAFNREPTVVEPGRSLRAHLEISWSSLT